MKWNFISSIYIAAAIFAATSPTLAQQTKPARIGFLMSGSPSTHGPYLKSLRKGLRDLGYVEGRTIVIEPRFAMGKRDRLSDLAMELIDLKSDVIVVTGARAAFETRKASATVPIVVATAGNLVASGVVASLARPGGNTTGMTALSGELGAKQLQLLKETIPRLSRVAILYNSAFPANRAAAEQITAAGHQLGVKILTLSVKSPKELEGAFGAMIKAQANAHILIVNRMMAVHRKRLIQLADKWKLPAMCWSPDLARIGCLMGYGANRLQMVRRSATHVERILKGAKPADLPVERPTKFDFVVNLKTAKALGIAFPPSILVQATEVIE